VKVSIPVSIIVKFDKIRHFLAFWGHSQRCVSRRCSRVFGPVVEMCEESELSELSPERAGPGIDDSGSRKTRAISAISAVRGCLECSLSLIKGFLLGHVASQKCARSPVLTCKLSPFPRSRRLCSKISIGGTSAYAWNPLLPVTHGTICLPTRFYQRLSRLPSGVRYPLAPVGPGFPVMWRFLSCQNCSIKRTH
jgi:hypothetical protein